MSFKFIQLLMKGWTFNSLKTLFLKWNQRFWDIKFSERQISPNEKKEIDEFGWWRNKHILLLGRKYFFEVSGWCNALSASKRRTLLVHPGPSRTENWRHDEKSKINPNPNPNPGEKIFPRSNTNMFSILKRWETATGRRNKFAIHNLCTR